MALIVSYDLRNPGRNYKPLYDLLERMGGYWILESVWYVNASYTPVSLRDALRTVVDSSDGIFVTELGPWATWNPKTNPPA